MLKRDKEKSKDISYGYSKQVKNKAFCQVREGLRTAVCRERGPHPENSGLQRGTRLAVGKKL